MVGSGRIFRSTSMAVIRNETEVNALPAPLLGHIEPIPTTRAPNTRASVYFVLDHDLYEAFGVSA